MLINLLSQLGIIITLLASLTQQVEVLQLQVDNLVDDLKVEVVEEVVLEEVKEPKKIGQEYEVLDAFKCGNDGDICECEIREDESIYLWTGDCEECGKIEEGESHIMYDPATKEYVGRMDAVCVTKPKLDCSEMGYWALIDGPDERLWKGYNYYEEWMGKCVHRGINKWMYYEDERWHNQRLGEGYAY